MDHLDHWPGTVSEAEPVAVARAAQLKSGIPGSTTPLARSRYGGGAGALPQRLQCLKRCPSGRCTPSCVCVCSLSCVQGG
eukprot:180274-Chlamydomonas_euryale.AAC.1